MKDKAESGGGNSSPVMADGRKRKRLDTELIHDSEGSSKQNPVPSVPWLLVYLFAELIVVVVVAFPFLARILGRRLDHSFPSFSLFSSFFFFLSGE